MSRADLGPSGSTCPDLRPRSTSELARTWLAETRCRTSSAPRPVHPPTGLRIEQGGDVLVILGLGPLEHHLQLGGKQVSKGGGYEHAVVGDFRLSNSPEADGSEEGNLDQTVRAPSKIGYASPINFELALAKATNVA